jgi:hypothetical protein
VYGWAPFKMYITKIPFCYIINFCKVIDDIANSTRYYNKMSEDQKSPSSEKKIAFKDMKDCATFRNMFSSEIWEILVNSDDAKYTLTFFEFVVKIWII